MSSAVAMILTIISGVFVFFICEIIREIWLVPLHEFHVLKSRITSALSYHARNYGSPIDLKTATPDMIRNYETTSSDLRQLACDLSGFTESLYIGMGIPSKEKLFGASKELIGLSNGVYTPYGVGGDHAQAEHNVKRVSTIKENLDIYYKRD